MTSIRAKRKRAFAPSLRRPKDRVKNAKMQIGGEGKLGIALGLMGLGGGAALFLLSHPYSDYVGWAMLYGCFAGLGALACHHFKRGRAFTYAAVGAITVAIAAAGWELSFKEETWVPRSFNYVLECPKSGPMFNSKMTKQQELETAQKAIKTTGDAWSTTIEFFEIDGGFSVELTPKPGNASPFSGITNLVYEIRGTEWRTLVTVILTFPVPTDALDIPKPSPSDPGAEQMFMGMKRDVEGLTGSKEGQCNLL